MHEQASQCASYRKGCLVNEQDDQSVFAMLQTVLQTQLTYSDCNASSMFTCMLCNLRMLLHNATSSISAILCVAGSHM